MNLGDKFANDAKWGGATGGKHVRALHGDNPTRTRRTTGFPPKTLMGLPWRVCFALQDDGWLLRTDIVWEHPTAMPEAVEDRVTRSHEYIFHMTKHSRYYYDAESIREPLKPKTLTTYGSKHHAQGNDASGNVKSDNWGRTVAERQPRTNVTGEMSGANKRSVWRICSEQAEGTHHATFPKKLVETCVLAGTAPCACEHCGTPWKRVYVRTGHMNTREKAHVPYNTPSKTDSTGWAPTRKATGDYEPGCSCPHNEGRGTCLVLDPFLGSGTTALVALQHHRSYTGIELNPVSVSEARERISVYQTGLWEFSA